MKYLAILAALALVGCKESDRNQIANVQSKTLTYQQLVDYPIDCSKKDNQLSYLRDIQTQKNFAEDPDVLDDYDRAYNGRLKATIWWYSYSCGESL
jgi:hypothetical protein